MAFNRMTVHPFTKPLDSTSPSSLVPPGGITQLDNAEYIVSPEGFSVTKRGGTTRYNATITTAGDYFTAVADFWRHGTSLTGTQKFVACVADKILVDSGTGVWSTLTGSGFGSNTAQSYITIAQGYAVISNDANNTPQIYDQTTIANINGGAKPKFKACVYHLRRLFTVGEQTPLSGTNNPSRSTISAAGDITDFSGADTGNIIFNEDDGDQLMGVSLPFRGRLYYFKGPNFGSVHELSGTTLTTFTQSPALKCAPCISHGSIITTPNDIFWASRYGFHSLQATQKFGDTEEFYLSRPIQTDFNRLNRSRFNQVRGFYHPTRNIVGWIVPAGGATDNAYVFVYNYAIGGWSIWKLGGFKTASVMVALTPTTLAPRLYFGGTNGYLYSGDQTNFGDESDATAISMVVQSPTHLKMPNKDELTEAQFNAVTSIVRPTGAYTVTLAASVDGRSQSLAPSLAGTGSGDLIGTTFIMNTSTISAASQTTVVPSTVEDVGRNIQLTWTQSGLNQDFQLYGYAVDYKPGNTESREIT